MEHNLKVAGSSPARPTMKIEISDYYRQKGYKYVYVIMNKEPRRMAILRKPDGTMKTISYAKYLYTSHYKCDVMDGDHVDHINADKLDDRIENLQVISAEYNIKKDKKGREMVEMVCPVCGSKFLFEKRNIPFRNNPCCSRRCGGIKSHWSLKENLQKETK